MKLKKKDLSTVSNKGYTLLEALLGIIVMSILILLIMFFILVLKDNSYNDYSKRELMLFVSQVQTDFLISKNIEAKEGNLYLTTYNKDTISYKQDKNRLIRQLNGKGYEIMLEKIKNINFTEDGNLVKIKIKFDDKREYEGYLGAV